MGGIGSLINQSKNASSNASTQSTTDSNNDNSYGSHNADYSGSEHHDTNYDTHGVVSAGAGSTVNVTDEGAVAVALDTIKTIALGLAEKVKTVGGGGAGDTANYNVSPPGSRIPTVAYVAGAVVLLAMVAVGIIIIRRKK